MIQRILIAGQGGQGALRIGQMIAYTAIQKGLETTWLPSYGAEMRGGTANCSVIVSDEEIACPMLTEADYCLVMNTPSFRKFKDMVVPGGVLVINSSMIAEKSDRQDIRTLYVPADAIADEVGNKRGVNMVMLGAYLALAGTVSLEAIYAYIDYSFQGRKAAFAEPNKELVKRGYDCARECV